MDQKHPNEIARTVGFWEREAPTAIGSMEWWGQTWYINMYGGVSDWQNNHYVEINKRG